MYGYIYRTINLINGKKYIGKRKSNKFLANNYLGSGKILNQAIEKYGKENFKVELIEWCNNKDVLSEKERYWIEYYNAVKSENYYNLAKGGEGWNYNHKGNNHPMYGKHHSDETRLKMSLIKKGKSNSNKGRYHSQETKDKISKAMKNKTRKPMSQKTKDKISKANKGKKFSEEHRINLSKALKNKTRKPMSQETKDKISKSEKLTKNLRRLDNENIYKHF